MNRETLERRMTIALSNLVVDDWRLLTTWASGAGPGSERSIACALAWHIKGVMERSWDVDCEYSRTSAGSAAGVKKATETRRHGRTNADVRPPVSPDILIHRRGLPDAANNLFVLELKKKRMRVAPRSEAGGQRSEGGSLKSILDVQQQFGYQHAVVLDLQLGRRGPAPVWTWVEFGEAKRRSHVRVGETREEVDARYGDLQCAVYNPGAVAALRQRGLAEEERRYGGR